MDRVVLLSLAGFGNAVLRALLESGTKPIALVTRKERFSYPYYHENNIETEAESNGIKIMYGADGENYIAKELPEILLMSTYHRILKPIVYSHCKYAINFHPSLLPRYKGASPIYWALRNGESKTGVTAHLITEKADVGDIVAQVEVPITDFDTQGTLRKKLALVTGKLAVDVLRLVKTNSVKPVSQNLTSSTSYPKVDDTTREIDPSWSTLEIERHLRALSPFPGAIRKGQIDQPIYLLSAQLNQHQPNDC
mgnify:CR=1 FL=1